MGWVGGLTWILHDMTVHPFLLGQVPCWRCRAVSAPPGGPGQCQSPPGCAQALELTTVACQMALFLRGKAGAASSTRGYQGHLCGHPGCG